MKFYALNCLTNCTFIFNRLVFKLTKVVSHCSLIFWSVETEPRLVLKKQTNKQNQNLFSQQKSYYVPFSRLRCTILCPAARRCMAHMTEHPLVFSPGEWVVGYDKKTVALKLIRKWKFNRLKKNTDRCRYHGYNFNSTPDNCTLPRQANDRNCGWFAWRSAIISLPGDAIFLINAYGNNVTNSFPRKQANHAIDFKPVNWTSYNAEQSLVLI